jgi:hypothetical protein
VWLSGLRPTAPLEQIRLSSKPYKTIVPALLLSTHCAHRISTCFAQPGELNPPLSAALKRLSFRGDFIPEESAFEAGSSFARNRTHSSAPQPVLFGTSRHGRLFTWEKTLWRFLRRTLKPFEEPCPRMQTSWPRPISGFNLFYLMPDERREIQLKRPASHTTALDDSLLYHRIGRSASGSLLSWVTQRSRKLEPTLESSCGAAGLGSAGQSAGYRPVDQSSDIPLTDRGPGRQFPTNAGLTESAAVVPGVRP